MVNVYDLDGTLSQLNNTFDFVFGYLHRKHRIRYYIGRGMHFLIFKLSFLKLWIRRRILIDILFFGLSNKQLDENFA